MNQREIGELKDLIIDEIIANDRIIELLEPVKDEDWDRTDLLYSQIFNYNRLPFTIEEDQTFITVEIEAEKDPNISAINNTSKTLSIVLNVVCSDRKMKVRGSRVNRVDLITAELDNMFNEQKHWGLGTVHFRHSVPGVLETKHPYRITEFDLEVLDNLRWRRGEGRS